VHKAIFANAQTNYPRWEQYLAKENLEYGALAENITLSNINEDDVSIGDIHKIGDVILEVSQPREPCWKIGQKFLHKEFTKYIYDSGETGWYYRVLQEGTFKVEDDVILVKKSSNTFTIFQANDLLRDPSSSITEAKRLVELDVLGEPFRNSLNKKIKS
jgi:MOSC domain-containing protein YiiM